MIDKPSGHMLTSLSEKYLSWSEELEAHSATCPLCWSISEASSTHRLARLELLH